VYFHVPAFFVANKYITGGDKNKVKSRNTKGNQLTKKLFT